MTSFFRWYLWNSRAKVSSFVYIALFFSFLCTSKMGQWTLYFLLAKHPLIDLPQEINLVWVYSKITGSRERTSELYSVGCCKKKQHLVFPVVLGYIKVYAKYLENYDWSLIIPHWLALTLEGLDIFRCL